MSQDIRLAKAIRAAQVDFHLTRVKTFQANIEFEDIPEIADISLLQNQFLYPIHQIYIDKVKDFQHGIYIADMKGIYVPIETGGYGVVHVERLPLGKPAVYGLADLIHSAYIRVGNQVIIYTGVHLTNYGFVPISEDSFVKPVLGLSFSNPGRLLLMRDGVKLEDIQQDDEEIEEFES